MITITETQEATYIPLTPDTTEVMINDNYRVKFAKLSAIVICIGAMHSKASKKVLSFEHPNLLGITDRVFEFKHYHEKRGKFWTSAAGREFYFAIPKEKIEVKAEEGYSNVPVRINGVPLRLNVSGGTMNGWTDWVGECAHTHCAATIGQLKGLSEAALTIPQAREIGVVKFAAPKEDEDKFQSLVSAGIVRDVLSPGSVVVNCIGKVYSFVGFIPKKHAIHVRDATGKVWSCRYGIIDWFATAKANNISLPEMKYVDSLTVV